jgi:MFS transporter, FSR family, fosmidomycin resistance protein
VVVRTALHAAGHAIDDLYQGSVPAIVPFLVAERHYGYLAASGVTVAATLLGSLVQPVFGLLTDRWRLPWLVPAGMAVAGTGIAACGLFAPYPLVLAAVALSGLGVAAYHPEAARLARADTAGSHVGMSWFSLGGNIGFALGPLIVTPVVGTAGLPGTPLLAVPALAGALVIAPVVRHRAAAAASRPRAVTGTANWPAFARLTVAVVGRSVVFFGLSTFLALYVKQRLHAGTVAGEAALAVLFVFGAAGTLLGGRLANRYGRVRVVRTAYAAAVPALAGLVLVPGPALYLFVAAVAITLYVPFSLHVTLGQDYLPHRVGTASGVTLGLAMSIGGLAAPALGALATATSLHLALALLLALPITCWLTTHHLPEPTPTTTRTQARLETGTR